jgi:hypothetical protein
LECSVLQLIWDALGRDWIGGRWYWDALEIVEKCWSAEVSGMGGYAAPGSSTLAAGWPKVVHRGV